ncbi:MAG: hypothetical protein OXH52_17305 [Gammaproteobacteria bacterium]|nr:hypothetical protein [Gammaproteobacteria bacterium]
MNELPLAERLHRLTSAADHEALAFASWEDRGQAIYRACLGACQILDARPDADGLRLRQEPPAPDYRDIWTRLNLKWRDARGC